ncbi:MAG TPA: hypothetical protein VH306_09005 [Gaiellaceae bacterium]|jgi:hypothetical protein
MGTLVFALVFMVLVVGLLAGWAVREDHRRRRAAAETPDERWLT